MERKGLVQGEEGGRVLPEGASQSSNTRNTNLPFHSNSRIRHLGKGCEELSSLARHLEASSTLTAFLLEN